MESPRPTDSDLPDAHALLGREEHAWRMRIRQSLSANGFVAVLGGPDLRESEEETLMTGHAVVHLSDPAAIDGVSHGVIHRIFTVE